MDKQELYVNVRFPFCPGHCVFCDDRTYGENITDATRYRTALEKEINAAADELAEYDIKSVHVGGGALGILGYGSLENFLDKLQRKIPARSSKWTVEMLPSEISLMNLTLLKVRGINKIALGIMGMSKDELRALHRPYSINLVEHAVEQLKQTTEFAVSAELVIGIPGQSVEQLAENITKLADAGFGEIRLTRYHDKTKTPAAQREYAEETDWQAYIKAADDVLCKSGYERAGKSLVFAKPGCGFDEYRAGTDAFVMGFGVGAVTRLDGFSYHNTARIADYFAHSDSFEEIAILD